MLRRYLADLHYPVDLRDYQVGCSCHRLVEVLLGHPVNKVACPVRHVCAQEGDVSSDSTDQHVVTVAESPGLLVLGYHGSGSGWRIERGDACPAGPQCLCK